MDVIRIVCLAFFLLFFNTTFANNFTQYGRYLIAEHKNVHSDSFLNLTIKHDFSANVKTVKDAIQELLKDTGYTLLTPEPVKAIQSLYQKSLPNVDRILIPTHLESALLRITGPAYQILIDPVNRLVSFRLRETYKAL